MFFSAQYCISYISRYITLHEGDLIILGTPPPIQEIQEGDLLEARLTKDNDVIAQLNVTVHYAHQK